ncbi:MAG: ABC-type sugar transport system periplasmic component-like protein [Cryobacterium sp.]|nr:ABC-type sugar transport system periplasmic component-like protein [Cryobacterium sp.]
MNRNPKATARIAILTTLVAASATLAGCSAGGDTGGGDGGGDAQDSYTVAVLAASSQNGYNQAVYQGVEEKAKEIGSNIQLKLLDGQFKSDVQLAQLENAGSTGQYDGVVVVPNDGPGLAAAFPLANDVPVVTVLNPIGPDIDKMEPQVEGVVSTVAVPPSDAAAKQAEGVVEYCATIDPCKVALVLGLLGTPLDVAREKAFHSVLDKEDNIQIVATVEGAYDRDTSLTAVSNVLQANKDLNVILSNADQQTSGAQIALENAGIDPTSVYLTGGGGTKDAVAAVRAGTWKADYINFPVSMGAAAMDQLYNALTGEDVEPVVNADEVGEVEPYATKETLDQTPDFVGEWVG